MNIELNGSHDTVDGMKDKLVRDLKGVVTDSDNLMKGVTKAAVDGMSAARTTVEGKLGEAKSRLDDARIAIADRARGAADATHVYVSEHPWKILGIAALAGLIIGALLSRRGPGDGDAPP